MSLLMLQYCELHHRFWIRVLCVILSRHPVDPAQQPRQNANLKEQETRSEPSIFYCHSRQQIGQFGRFEKLSLNLNSVGCILKFFKFVQVRNIGHIIITITYLINALKRVKNSLSVTGAFPVASRDSRIYPAVIWLTIVSAPRIFMIDLHAE